MTTTSRLGLLAVRLREKPPQPDEKKGRCDPAPIRQHKLLPGLREEPSALWRCLQVFSQAGPNKGTVIMVVTFNGEFKPPQRYLVWFANHPDRFLQIAKAGRNETYSVSKKNLWCGVARSSLTFPWHTVSVAFFIGRPKWPTPCNDAEVWAIINYYDRASAKFIQDFLASGNSIVDNFLAFDGAGATLQ